MSVPTHQARDVPLNRVQVAAGFNVRQHVDDELVSSIREVGILQSILVREIGRGWYEVIAGHRRRLAAIKLGLVEVPVRILSPEVDAERANFLENADRRNITVYEEAVRFQQWHEERGMMVEQIAEMIGRSKVYVLIRLQLLNDLHPDVIEKWKQNESASLFAELRVLVRWPKDQQVAEYNRLRNLRELHAKAKADRLARGDTQVEDDEAHLGMGERSRVGRPRVRNFGKPRLTIGQCNTLIRKKIPNAHLSDEMKTLAIELTRYIIGARRNPPFAIKRGPHRVPDPDEIEAAKEGDAAPAKRRRGTKRQVDKVAYDSEAEETGEPMDLEETFDDDEARDLGEGAVDDDGAEESDGDDGSDDATDEAAAE